MAQIYNSDLSKEMQKAGGLQVSKDAIPNQLAEKVVPVMEVNPSMLRKCNVIRFASSETTLYTTPTDRDFYLIGAAVNIGFNAASKTGGIGITVVPKGEGTQTFLTTRAITTVAIDCVSNSNSISLKFPMLLERGSAITSAKSGTDLPGVFTAHIYGYVVDTANA